MHCPNINSPEWKSLISKVPVPTAYELWDRYEGNVPESAIKKELGEIITTLSIPTSSKPISSVPVKSGVSDLFDSNPELANQVYEALGFGTFNKTYSYKNDIVNKFDADVETIINGMRNVSIADNEDYNIELELKQAKKNNIQHLKYVDKNNITHYIFYNKEGENQAKAIYNLRGLYGTKEYQAQLGYLLQYNIQDVKDFTGVQNINKLVTPQQKQQALQAYSQYLDTIFPDSKVKDIVYHGSYAEKIDKFSKEILGRTSLTGFLPKGFYLTNQKYVAATYTANKEVYNRAVWDSLINVLEGIKDEDGSYYQDPMSFEKLLSYIGESGNGKEFIIDYRDGKLEDSFGGAAEAGLILPSKEDVNLYLKLIKNKDLEGIKKKRDTYSDNEGNIFPVILNIKNPLNKRSQTGSITTINLDGKTTGDKRQTLEKELKNSDGLIVSDIRDSSDYKPKKEIKYNENIDEQTYVVFEPEQIHILGNQQDIEKFKKFVASKPTSTKQETKEVTLKEATDKLDSTMKTILAELGISYEAVDEILSAEGEATRAVAKADLAKRAIEVVEGRADATTLTEETVHFLIEMLDKNSHVYKSMYDQITKYAIFQEVVNEYGNTPGYTQDRLRKEAMAKLITRELVDNSEGETSLAPREQKTLLNWWNMLLAKLKQVVKNFNSEKLDNAIEEYSPFKEIAYKIANKDLSMFNQDIEDSHTYYQLSNSAPNAKQQSVLDIIKKISAGITREGTDATRGYYKEGKKLGKSVTTRRDEKMSKKFTSARSAEQETLMKESGAIGSLVHDDMDNISKRVLSRDKGVAKVVKTNPEIYGKLENFANQLLKFHGEDAIYLSEQMVYDPVTDTPGTIDLIVIDRDGVTHTYDWKTMTFKKVEKEEYGEPARWKTESYEYQLNSYKNILESGGIKDFGKRRYIPIEKLFKTDKASGKTYFVGINIGTPTGSRAQDKLYLNPVPVSNEQTGEKPIDDLISELLALYKKINAKKSANPVEVAKKRQQLTSLNRSIRDLQLNKNLGTFADTAELQFKAIEARLNASKKTPLSEAELVDIKEQLQVYTDISSKFAPLYKDDKIPEAHIKKFDAIAGKANRLDITIKELLEEHFRKVAMDSGLSEDALDHFKKKGAKPIGMADKLSRALSRIDHPIFKTFWNLVNKAKTQIKKDTVALEKEISEKLDALKQEANAEGLKGTDIFNSMVDKKTGKLISKHSPEFYKLKAQKIKAGDWKWVKDNTTVDEAGLKAYIKEQENFIKKYQFSSDAKHNEFIRTTKLKDLHNRFDVFNNPQAYVANDSYLNRFVKPSDKWLSNEYKNLRAKKAAFAFYNLFTSKMKEFGEFMPLGSENKWVNTDRFIPNLKADLIERGLNAGGTPVIGGLGKGVVDMLDYDYDPEMNLGDINEFTGEFERRVPVYYTKEIDPKEKSYDLGRVLYMFGNKAYNYKYMSEVEGSARNLRNVLADSGESLVDANGKVLKNVLKDSKTISADTLTTFDKFLNYYVYGVKEEDNGSITYKKKVINPKTGEEEIKEVHISKNKATKGLLKAFATKALGLNLISGGAQIFGNNVNSVVLAMGGQHFNFKQWLRAKAEITSGSFNPEVYQFLEILDIRGDNNVYKKADSLSVNSTTRQANLEKAFFLYEYGDNALFKTVSVAFIQNHGVDENGKIVALKKLPEGSKSIREMLVIKEDGTSNITDIIKSEEEFRKMRNKIQAIGEKITGMSTRDNMSGWRLSVAGQSLMQFRGWIPRTFAARLQGARYDSELELVEKGRYISLFQEIVHRRILPITKQLLGAATAGQFAANSEDYIDTLYNKFMEENPHLSREEVTREMFYETHVANVKAGLMEVALYLTFIMLIGGLKEGWDDDDDDKRFKSETMKALNRFSDEIGFYLNPNSFQAITKGAVPAVGLFTDIGNFFKEVFGEVKGQAIDDEVAIHNNKPLWRFARTFIPGGSTMWNWFGDKSKLTEEEEDE